MSSAAPVYMVNKLDAKFSPSRNKTIIGLVYAVDKEKVEKIALSINNFFIPFSAFIVVVVCTAVLVMKLRSAAKWREKSASQGQVDRVSQRNQKVAKMVVVISTLFIVCSFPMSMSILAASIFPEINFGGKHLFMGLMLAGFSLIMESINSSSNIIIYYHMSMKYRETFRHIFCLEQVEKTN